MPEDHPQLANSLTQVLGKSERIKDIVEECADDLSSVNAGLKRELNSRVGAKSLAIGPDV